jgi:hypothetical protein
MEATLGISLHSYLYPKLAKTVCLSSYLLCFLFNKIREEGRIGSVWKLEWGRGEGRVFGWWAATPWPSGTLCSTFHSTPSFLSWLPWQLQCKAIRDFQFHPPSSSPLVTMATPAGGQWVLTYPTDPYYPELLPTKPQPIQMPHNTLRS